MPGNVERVSVVCLSVFFLCPLLAVPGIPIAEGTAIGGFESNTATRYLRAGPNYRRVSAFGGVT